MLAVPQRRRMRESLCREGKSDSVLFQDVTPGLTKLHSALRSGGLDSNVRDTETQETAGKFQF